MNFTEKDLPEGFTIMTDGVSTYACYHRQKIYKYFEELTGENGREGLTDIGRSRWDKEVVIDFEENFLPQYTYTNTIFMMILKEGLSFDEPQVICSTEY